MTNNKKELKILAESSQTERGTQDKHNILCTDDEFDYLFDANGNMGTINICENVRREIKKQFKKHKKFYYYPEQPGGFKLIDMGTMEYSYNLAQLIVAKREGITIPIVSKYHIEHRDGDKLNLLNDNLEWVGSSGDSSQNKFYEKGDKFIIRHIDSGKEFYTVSNDELNKILEKYRWNLVRKGKWHLCTYHNGWQYDLGHFIYAFYEFCMTETTITSSLNKVKRLLKQGFVVDHFDDNPENNIKWNLSIMKKSENTAKSNLVSRFVKPFALNGFYEDGAWTIILGYIDNNGLTPIAHQGKFFLRFTTAQQLITYLQYFADEYIKGQTAKDNYKAKKETGEDLRKSSFENQWLIREMSQNSPELVVENPDKITKISKKEYMKKYYPLFKAAGLPIKPNCPYVYFFDRNEKSVDIEQA